MLFDGKALSPMTTRSIRLFLSSTFRDFGEERDLLVRQVFPALRARLKDRFVELADVDNADNCRQLPTTAVAA
jgi:hypothetical protein